MRPEKKKKIACKQTYSEILVKPQGRIAISKPCRGRKQTCFLNLGLLGFSA
jgi:hypothetical protein